MRKSDTDQWFETQTKTFTAWINGKLSDSRGLFINDLFEDLRDGIVLYNLMEVLSHCSLSKVVICLFVSFAVFLFMSRC